MNKSVFRINNFDILRLLAALQVATNHAVEIMHIPAGPVLKHILRFSYYFPGVPIFFFISGFLISKSYENNHRLSEYFQNRVLRLYPGLITTVTLSFILIAVSGYMASTGRGVLDWAMLFIGKTTFLQFYNPEFMRAYGDGVLNGSLWTITVELQFYLIIPIVYGVFKFRNPKKSTWKLLGLIAFFLVINRLYAYIPNDYHSGIPFKLMRVSFLPWFYMFLIGMLVQKNFEFFHKILSQKILLVFPVYCVIGYIALTNHWSLGNNINPIIFIFLVTTVFTFAYSFSSLTSKILKGNDISYGVYIYHMPIVDFLIYSGYSGKIIYAFYALATAIVLAILSWVFIEKSSLRLKKHPLNPLNRGK